MFGEALAGRKMFSLVNERLDLRVPRLRLRDHFRKEIIGTQLGILLRDPGVLFYGGLVTLHQLEVGGVSVEHVAIEGLLHVAELVKNRGLSTKQRRSEEHTSELQSHLNLVCRLLLEKKKNKDQQEEIYKGNR